MINSNYSGIYPKTTHTTLEIPADLLTVARKRKQLKFLLIGGWIIKMQLIYIIEYHSAIKNKIGGEQMELETVFMTKATQTQKGKYHLFSIFYFIFVTIFYVSGELIKSLVY